MVIGLAVFRITNREHRPARVVLRDDATFVQQGNTELGRSSPDARKPPWVQVFLLGERHGGVRPWPRQEDLKRAGVSRTILKRLANHGGRYTEEKFHTVIGPISPPDYTPKSTQRCPSQAIKPRVRNIPSPSSFRLPVRPCKEMSIPDPIISLEFLPTFIISLKVLGDAHSGRGPKWRGSSATSTIVIGPTRVESWYLPPRVLFVLQHGHARPFLPSPAAWHLSLSVRIHFCLTPGQCAAFSFKSRFNSSKLLLSSLPRTAGIISPANRPAFVVPLKINSCSFPLCQRVLVRVVRQVHLEEMKASEELFAHYFTVDIGKIPWLKMGWIRSWQLLQDVHF
ncbi:hypothetical protein V8F20_003908 [Naviculisporaceae sp. PSN 640]